ncbi:MAG: YccF domain-containing protein [Caldilineales bacterium]|nr:YccF domain-containing protein [Caldilineales bacterium]MDW8316536.1 YccF domain-containing protein [Anaerolineae bacterium]
MSLLGNIIWLIFGGFLAGLGYILGGLLLCLTIVGIPFGLQAIKLGWATFAPFGKQIVELPDANRPLRLIFNVIWLVFIGWEIALAHAGSALLLAITIIGIPFALQHLKLIPLALLPFGRDLRAVPPSSATGGQSTVNGDQ